MAVHLPMLKRLKRSRSTTSDSSDERLRALIDEHAAAVYRVALGIVRDPSLAEDVVQETMIKAWRSIESFRGESSERGWILRIAHNTAVSTLRRIRDEATDPSLIPERMTVDTETRAEQRADLAALRGALDELDELSRSILVLRDVEALPYSAIADTLGVSVPLVKTRLLRARRELQRSVEGVSNER